MAAQRRSLQQPLQSPDLLDDSELATDDRDLDADVTGECGRVEMVWMTRDVDADVLGGCRRVERWFCGCVWVGGMWILM